MTQKKKPDLESVIQQQIAELTAIYDDYMFIVRQHEHALSGVSIRKLADDQMEILRPGLMNFIKETKTIDANTIQKLAYIAKPVWKITPLNIKERQEFEDFITNNVSENENKAYIVLQHIKTEENKWEYPIFSIPPYTMRSIGTQLPSLLERFAIVYPESGTVGDVEFYIDGLYKIFCNDKKDILIKDALHDENFVTELCMTINGAEQSRKNIYVDVANMERKIQHLFAEERVSINEMIILELLGAFAEKLLKLCRNKYNLPKDKGRHDIDVLQYAQTQGFIQSAQDFQDYINIRHFLRHQWDSLTELGVFNPEQSEKTKQERKERIASYLKLCDKPLKQRIPSYIHALHRMQYVIEQINPNRIIRGVSESNNKFIKRVKAKAWQNFASLEVELNYPRSDKKYTALAKNLYKIAPVKTIVDDVSKDVHIDDYKKRTYMLQDVHGAEYLVMRHCLMRGYNLSGLDAWKHLKNIGVLSEQEYNTWYQYRLFRNILGHSYFAPEIRKQLFEQESAFAKDMKSLVDKFATIGPDVRKVGDRVFEFTHDDGKVVQLDFKKHKIDIIKESEQEQIMLHRNQQKGRGKIQNINLPQIALQQSIQNNMCR